MYLFIDHSIEIKSLLNNMNKRNTKRGASLSDSPLKFKKDSIYAQRYSQSPIRSVNDVDKRNY